MCKLSVFPKLFCMLHDTAHKGWMKYKTKPYMISMRYASLKMESQTKELVAFADIRSTILG